MLKQDYLSYPYSSRRITTFAKRGMVATSQPLAAQAGLEMLKRGGNAIDAAIATAACLTVVEPTSNGIGGDAFALIWTKGKLHGLNASGYSPKNISAEKLKNRGLFKIPDLGVIPVTVPGCPSAWAELSEKMGELSFSELLEPAINYAKEGYPVSPICSFEWKECFDIYRKLSGREFEEWFNCFTIKGRAPEIGEVWKSKDHTKTLISISESKAESFYRGELAERIHDFIKENDGYLSKEDLAEYKPEWVTPISVNYMGYDIWEIPPNGQGLIALIALNILKNFDIHFKEDVETYHRQIEAMKLAFTDGQKYITDPRDMKVRTEELLSLEYGLERKALIENKAITPIPGKLQGGGTVYLATADDKGNMVSYIQSNYKGFGSGTVVPGTGIALQNRGKDFSLNIEDSNYLRPKKRTYHTIIPGFITKGDLPVKEVGPFGVMGGYMQPQGHLQVIMNMIDFDLNPQAALDAPRWQWKQNKQIEVEKEMSHEIIEGLCRRGHEVVVSPIYTSFGRGQIILKDHSNGTLIGGTEKRADSSIAAF